MKITRKNLERLIKEEIDEIIEQIGTTQSDPGSMDPGDRSQTLKLGPEFGPAGQLKARLAAKDPEQLNKLGNQISSGIRYMLERPQSGKDDQNIEYTLKAVDALKQYIEFRLLGLLDPDRPAGKRDVQIAMTQQLSKGS